MNRLLLSNKFYIDRTKESYQVLSYHIKQYYLSEKKLTNYSQAVTLIGLRRTGKSTVLVQLWDKFKTEKSVFLEFIKPCNIDVLMDFIDEKQEIDYLFIDEITFLYGLDTDFHIILNTCSHRGIKLVLTGTNSYLISEAMYDSAYGRLDTVFFNPLWFLDLCSITHNSGFEDFYLGKTRLAVNDNPIISLALNLYQSIEISFDLHKSTIGGMDTKDFITAVNIILETLSSNYGLLPKTRFELLIKNYSISNNIKEDVVSLKHYSVKKIFEIMKALHLIRPLYIFSLETRQAEREAYYVSVPALYIDLLQKYNIYSADIREQKLGYLYETAVITQILLYIDMTEQNDIYSIYTIRDDSETLRCEIDLAIKNVKTNGLLLLEFKKSHKKSGKYFHIKEIKEYCKEHSSFQCLTVTGDSLPQAKESNPYKVDVSDFLNNLNTYLP